MYLSINLNNEEYCHLCYQCMKSIPADCVFFGYMLLRNQQLIVSCVLHPAVENINHIFTMSQLLKYVQLEQTTYSVSRINSRVVTDLVKTTSVKIKLMFSPWAPVYYFTSIQAQKLQCTSGTMFEGSIELWCFKVTVVAKHMLSYASPWQHFWWSSTYDRGNFLCNTGSPPNSNEIVTFKCLCTT